MQGFREDWSQIWKGHRTCCLIVTNIPSCVANSSLGACCGWTQSAQFKSLIRLLAVYCRLIALGAARGKALSQKLQALCVRPWSPFRHPAPAQPLNHQCCARELQTPT